MREDGKSSIKWMEEKRRGGGIPVNEYARSIYLLSNDQQKGSAQTVLHHQMADKESSV